MALTLTKKELCDIRCTVENVFLEVESKFSKANSLGRKPDMEVANELYIYTYLMREVSLPKKALYQDDTYASILSNEDIYKIYNRTLNILSNVRAL